MSITEAQTRIAETLLVTEDLIAALNPKEDMEKIGKINFIKEDARKRVEERDRDCKEIIKELQNAVKDLKEITAVPPENKFYEQNASLQQEKEKKAQEVGQLSSVVEERVQSVGRVTDENEYYAQLKVQQEVNKEGTIPNVANILRLYTTISSITWDYECKDAIKGSCHMIHSKTVKPFKLPLFTAQGLQGRVQVADSLWDMMSEDNALSA